MLRRAVRATWLAASCTLAFVSAAQEPQGARIPTVSRLVMLFTQQESRLAERLSARDAAGAGDLLADDFELRAGPEPGRAIPRADWLRQSMQSAGGVVPPTQMAVHDLGNAAVVSFLQRFKGTKTEVFVVDVWRRAGDEWKLAIRYVAPGGYASFALPGVPPQAAAIPKRY